MPNTAEIDITEIVKPHYERGLEQGLEQGRIETAHQLKKKGMDNQFIQEVTELSKEQIAKL